MKEIIQDLNHDIFSEKQGPFISIYQNTHRSPTDVQQDILTFKNYLKTCEASLRKKYDVSLIKTILKPLHQLKENKIFWNGNTEAIAIFASLNDYVIFRLNKAVNAKVLVAEYLHTKPLIRHFQTRASYDVLTLTRETFALYTCNQDVCHKVEFAPGTLVTKEEVLGTLEGEKYISHGSYDGASNQATYHGHEEGKGIIDKDTERYFRYVDQYINDSFSKITKQRLVLWTLHEHHSVFQKISKNKYLLNEGIKKSGKDLTELNIQKESWDHLKPFYEQEIKAIIDKYEHAQTKGFASDNIHEIGKKIIQANIDTVMFASEVSIPGKLNTEDGTIIEGSTTNTLYDDVLDELAEYTIKQGGSVIVLDDVNMPTKKGIAAIFRY